MVMKLLKGLLVIGRKVSSLSVYLAKLSLEVVNAVWPKREIVCLFFLLYKFSVCVEVFLRQFMLRLLLKANIPFDLIKGE